MLYCPNFFWNVLQVWMTGKDVYLQMTWSWPDKTWNILCSYCLQWNTSQSKFRNHYFLFLFAFSILSQLFLIWGCKCCLLSVSGGVFLKVYPWFSAHSAEPLWRAGAEVSRRVERVSNRMVTDTWERCSYLLWQQSAELDQYFLLKLHSLAELGICFLNWFAVARFTFEDWTEMLL